MRQRRVTTSHDPLAATPTAPPAIIDDPARQDRPFRLETLPGHLQAQTIQAGERGQIGGVEGTVRHVEVFQAGSVRTPIM